MIYSSGVAEIEPGTDKWAEYAIDAMGLVPHKYKQVVADLKAAHRRRGYSPVPERKVDR